MYEAQTRSIRVRVKSRFVAEESQPRVGRYFWAYTVEIANLGEETVQLVARHWMITDGAGRRETVNGEGVAGEKPVIAPGDSFTYTSGCPLGTPDGTMAGTYDMQTESGERFAADIPAFWLDSPYIKRTAH